MKNEKIQPKNNGAFLKAKNQKGNNSEETEETKNEELSLRKRGSYSQHSAEFKMEIIQFSQKEVLTRPKRNSEFRKKACCVGLKSGPSEI